MKRSTLALHLVAASMLIVAAGCGGQTRKTTKQDAPATPAKSEPAVAPAPPPKPASSPAGSTSAAPPVRSDAANKAPATPPIKAPEAKTTDARPSLQAEGAADFTKGYMKGRKIEEWIVLLDSKNKDEQQEAINVCALAGSKKALLKLEELSKSGDKDIAEDAKFAINRINNAGK